MLKIIFLSLVLVILTSCQSVQQKNKELVRDRVAKLQPLSRWQPMQCRLSTQITAPARARYEDMFPKEKEKLKADRWNYLWRAHQHDCAVVNLDSTPLIENHKSLLSTAVCVLLQTHYINSPFDGPDFGDAKLVRTGKKGEDERVQIQTGPEPELGIFVSHDILKDQTQPTVGARFSIETRTKARGQFTAMYGEFAGHQWLPERIEQRQGDTVIAVENIEYNSTMIFGRAMLRAFTISVGNQESVTHTRVHVVGCRI